MGMNRSNMKTSADSFADVLFSCRKNLQIKSEISVYKEDKILYNKYLQEDFIIPIFNLPIDIAYWKSRLNGGSINR